MAEISQDTLRSAGIGEKSDVRVSGLEGRQTDILSRQAERQGKIAEIAKSDEQLIKERGEALAPAREAISKKLKEAPDTTGKEEEKRQYEKPQMDPKGFKPTFGAILVASTVGGVAKRGDYR